MAFHSRKLIEFSVNETLEVSCPPTCVPTPDHCCPESCLRRCPYICFYPLAAPSPPSKSHKPSPTLLVTLLVLASFFLFVTLLFLYVRCYSRRRRAAAARRMNLAVDNTREEFIDEGHGPVVDHPIWYIRTVGLQPSVISAIAVCKYKKGEGIIEGSDCAVCLSEFFEGETLRLLPKCNHAFHIPCIDTWLRSHTNCPMCRAGIVVEAPTQEAISRGPDSGRGPELRIVDGNEELGDGVGELEDSTTLRVEETQSGPRNGVNVSENLKDEVQPMRRSVSMDSLSAKAITVALADVGRVESAGNSNSLSPEIGDSNTGIFPKGDDGNQSLFGVTGGSSSRGRHLQPGPMSLKRSLSCGAKLFLSREEHEKSRMDVG